MIRRKVILEVEGRGNRTSEENKYKESDIIEWFEKHETRIPYFGEFSDKLTIIYEEEEE